MKWSEAEDPKVSTSAPENDFAPATSAVLDTALYNGDKGELPLDTRRVLVQLLSGPSIDHKRHHKLWPVLIRDEEIIRRRLADLFLELVVDHDLRVAFTRQVDAGELEVPKLLRNLPLTFIDSVLLLYLRHQLAQAESRGERAAVSTEDIVQFLGIYERAVNTDRAGFTKRIHNSIEKIKKHSILQKLRESDDRFEVSPTLKLLFSASEIQALTVLYQRMIAGETLAVPEPPGSEEDAEDI